MMDRLALLKKKHPTLGSPTKEGASPALFAAGREMMMAGSREIIPSSPGLIPTSVSGTATPTLHSTEPVGSNVESNVQSYSTFIPNTTGSGGLLRNNTSSPPLSTTVPNNVPISNNYTVHNQTNAMDPRGVSTGPGETGSGDPAGKPQFVPYSSPRRMEINDLTRAAVPKFRAVQQNPALQNPPSPTNIHLFNQFPSPLQNLGNAGTQGAGPGAHQGVSNQGALQQPPWKNTAPIHAWQSNQPSQQANQPWGRNQGGNVDNQPHTFLRKKPHEYTHENSAANIARKRGLQQVRSRINSGLPARNSNSETNAGVSSGTHAPNNAAANAAIAKNPSSVTIANSATMVVSSTGASTVNKGPKVEEGGGSLNSSGSSGTIVPNSGGHAGNSGNTAPKQSQRVRSASRKRLESNQDKQPPPPWNFGRKDTVRDENAKKPTKEKVPLMNPAAISKENVRSRIDCWRKPGEGAAPDPKAPSGYASKFDSNNQNAPKSDNQQQRPDLNTDTGLVVTRKNSKGNSTRPTGRSSANNTGAARHSDKATLPQSATIGLAQTATAVTSEPLSLPELEKRLQSSKVRIAKSLSPISGRNKAHAANAASQANIEPASEKNADKSLLESGDIVRLDSPKLPMEVGDWNSMELENMQPMDIDSPVKDSFMKGINDTDELNARIQNSDDVSGKDSTKDMTSKDILTNVVNGIVLEDTHGPPSPFDNIQIDELDQWEAGKEVKETQRDIDTVDDSMLGDVPNTNKTTTDAVSSSSSSSSSNGVVSKKASKETITSTNVTGSSSSGADTSEGVRKTSKGNKETIDSGAESGKTNSDAMEIDSKDDDPLASPVPVMSKVFSGHNGEDELLPSIIQDSFDVQKDSLSMHDDVNLGSVVANVQEHIAGEALSNPLLEMKKAAVAMAAMAKDGGLDKCNKFEKTVDSNQGSEKPSILHILEQESTANFDSSQDGTRLEGLDSGGLGDSGTGSGIGQSGTLGGSDLHNGIVGEHLRERHHFPDSSTIEEMQVTFGYEFPRQKPQEDEVIMLSENFKHSDTDVVFVEENAAVLDLDSDERMITSASTDGRRVNGKNDDTNQLSSDKIESSNDRFLGSLDSNGVATLEPVDTEANRGTEIESIVTAEGAAVPASVIPTSISEMKMALPTAPEKKSDTEDDKMLRTNDSSHVDTIEEPIVEASNVASNVSTTPPGPNVSVNQSTFIDHVPARASTIVALNQSVKKATNGTVSDPAPASPSRQPTKESPNLPAKAVTPGPQDLNPTTPVPSSGLVDLVKLGSSAIVKESNAMLLTQKIIKSEVIVSEMAKTTELEKLWQSKITNSIIKGADQMDGVDANVFSAAQEKFPTASDELLKILSPTIMENSSPAAKRKRMSSREEIREDVPMGADGMENLSEKNLPDSLDDDATDKVRSAQLQMDLDRLIENTNVRADKLDSEAFDGLPESARAMNSARLKEQFRKGAENFEQFNEKLRDDIRKGKVYEERAIGSNADSSPPRRFSTYQSSENDPVLTSLEQQNANVNRPAESPSDNGMNQNVTNPLDSANPLEQTMNSNKESTDSANYNPYANTRRVWRYPKSKDTPEPESFEPPPNVLAGYLRPPSSGGLRPPSSGGLRPPFDSQGGAYGGDQRMDSYEGSQLLETGGIPPGASYDGANPSNDAIPSGMSYQGSPNQMMPQYASTPYARNSDGVMSPLGHHSDSAGKSPNRNRQLCTPKSEQKNQPLVDQGKQNSQYRSPNHQQQYGNFKQGRNLKFNQIDSKSVDGSHQYSSPSNACGFINRGSPQHGNGFNGSFNQQSSQFGSQNPSQNCSPITNRLDQDLKPFPSFPSNFSLTRDLVNNANDMSSEIVQDPNGLWIPQRNDEVRIECPHCGRKFSEEASQRHIPKCSKIQAKPRPPPSGNVILKTDRLGRRIKKVDVEFEGQQLQENAQTASGNAYSVEYKSGLKHEEKKLGKSGLNQQLRKSENKSPVGRSPTMGKSPTRGQHGVVEHQQAGGQSGNQVGIPFTSQQPLNSRLKQPGKGIGKGGKKAGKNPTDGTNGGGKVVTPNSNAANANIIETTPNQEIKDALSVSGSKEGSKEPLTKQEVSKKYGETFESQWGQAQILLAEGIEAVNTPEKYAATKEKAEEGLLYVAELERTANKLGIMKGKLSRCLLPFNSNTDAKNQSNVDNEMGSSELDEYTEKGLISEETRKRLVQSALAVRGFLRVKISDDADVDLLKDSLRLLIAFFHNLEYFCTREGMTPHRFVIDELGTPFKGIFRAPQH